MDDFLGKKNQLTKIKLRKSRKFEQQYKLNYQNIFKTDP